MRVLVKICGLRAPDAVEAALDAGADLIGVVLFPPSPRHASLDDARRVRAQVGSRVNVVALSVDAADDELAAAVEALAPDELQLHGHETPARVSEVRKRFGRPVIKALPVSQAADLLAARAYLGSADRLLFDARAPKDATRPGGLGTPFDWTLLAGFDAGIPAILSGGLDPSNVAEAIRVTGLTAVDVSSGVERAPGEKDAGLIHAFVRAARAGSSMPLARTA